MSKVLPDEQRRAEVFAEMTPELKKDAQEFRKILAQDSLGAIVLRYNMGEKIRVIIEKESTYGSNAVEQLAAYLGQSTTALYELRNVAECYTRTEIKDLAKREMANGNHISIAHIRTLVQIKRAADREKMTKRIFNESLTAAQLATEVAAGVDKTNTRGGGRPPAKPTSPLAGTQQIFEQFQTVNNRVEVWQGAVFKEIDQMEPDKFSPALVEKLKAALDQATKAEENATLVVTALEANLKRAEKVMKDRADAEKAQAKADRDAEKAADKAPPKEKGSKRPVVAA